MFTGHWGGVAGAHLIPTVLSSSCPFTVFSFSSSSSSSSSSFPHRGSFGYGSFRVGPRNKIGHPAHSLKRFEQVPVVNAYGMYIYGYQKMFYRAVVDG